MESGLGECLINCHIDIGISPFEFEAANPDAATGWLRRLGGSILGGKSSLKQVHPLNRGSDVLSHRTDRVEVLRFDRVKSFD